MAGTREDVTVRMKKNVVSWFGYVERMSDERMPKKTFNGNVSGKRGWGRPRLTFENTVSKILEERQRKTHEDPPKSTYEEVDDSGRGERGLQRSLRLALRSLRLPR